MHKICPRCAQGDVRAMRIRATDVLLWVCEECDATWKNADEIETARFADFGLLMEDLGYKPLWSELEPQ